MCDYCNRKKTTIPFITLMDREPAEFEVARLCLDCSLLQLLSKEATEAWDFEEEIRIQKFHGSRLEVQRV